jgi:hypothetical protein
MQRDCLGYAITDGRALAVAGRRGMSTGRAEQFGGLGLKRSDGAGGHVLGCVGEQGGRYRWARRRNCGLLWRDRSLLFWRRHIGWGGDFLRLGPGSGAGVMGLAPHLGSSTGHACLGHEWGKKIVQALSVLGAEVDLVLLAVQGKGNGVLGLAAIEIVYEDDRT